MTKVKFAIPKGHLEGDTLKMLERAGYQISDLKRTYRPSINDLGIELKVLRPQEIPTFVNEGVQDIGISGKDWIAENRADVEILLDLEYSRVRLVVAVPKSWTDVNSLSDLLRKKMERGETLRPRAAMMSSWVAAALSAFSGAPVSSQSAWSLSHFLRLAPSFSSNSSTLTTMCLGRTAMDGAKARSTS